MKKNYEIITEKDAVKGLISIFILGVLAEFAVRNFVKSIAEDIKDEKRKKALKRRRNK